jgi:hypothetical protein
MDEEQARRIAEKLFTTSSGVEAAKLIQADAAGGPIDELDLDTVERIISEALGAPEDE